MRRWRVILWWAAWLVPGGVLLAAEQPTPWRIESVDPVEYDLESGQLTATNGVTVYYGTTTLSARRAYLNQQTGDVEADGEVLLQRGGQIWRGERLRYNFNTGRMTGEEFRTGQAPAYAAGEVVVADQEAGVYVLANGYVTTDDYSPPSYRIQTRNLVVVPGEYVEARHATLRLGNTPVFYFPYFRKTLKPRGNHWTATPGYRSVDGPFLLTTYHWYGSEDLEGKVHIDGRVKRGVGVGPDFSWNLHEFGEGEFRSYYVRDQDPGENRLGEELDPDRYRFWFSHLAEPWTNLTVRGVFRYQSDEEVVRDFFESEYRDNVQPGSYLEITKQWSNYSLDVLGQPRVNDFFETVERLPDVKLTGFRQQILHSPLFYENESSAGWYRRKFAYDATNSFSAARADSFHQITLPKTLLNWLNVTPRVGGRYTYYEEAHGDGAVTDQEDRWVFNTGAEVSFKASRVWRGAQSKTFDVEGLRHIFQPSLNYVYVPEPTTRPPDLPQFDYVVPSTRLLPIEYPDFNAIDGVDSQNVLRMGMRNKFQTKRKGEIDNLVNWALVLDWRLSPRSDQETFSDLYSDLDLKPFSWLTLASETRYNINDHLWSEVNHAVIFSPTDRWSFAFGQRYLRDDPTLGVDSGNNLFYTTLYYRMSDNWGWRMHHRFEADDGTLEEQDYTLYRDLRSWTAALTLRVRDERDGPTDITAAVTFSLKAFPRFNQGDDINRPTRLLGN